jgi:hypothetical protein
VHLSGSLFALLAPPRPGIGLPCPPGG